MKIDISYDKSRRILKKIVKEGTGDKVPGIGSFVTLHYVGVLMNGKTFDSSKTNGKPFQFDLGQGQVIIGFDISVSTMKKDEISIFTIDPSYGYGKHGNLPYIPPNATLKFKIHLLDWIGEDLSPDKDQGIVRDIIKHGHGHSSPDEGTLVYIHLIGMYNGQVFEERDVKFEIGEGEAEGIVRGVEISLMKFKKSDKAKVNVSSKYAYGAEGNSKLNIPPNADLEYIIELKNFEDPVNAWNLDGSERLEQVQMFKDKAAAYLKNKKYTSAIKMYNKMVQFTSHKHNYKEDLMDSRTKFLITANLNLSLCFLKTQQYGYAKDCCNWVLKLDPNNEKAFYRRGLIYLDLAFPELAIKDFEAVVKIEPKNKAAANQIIICNNLLKKELLKEKRMYANMFDKFAKEDQQKLEDELRNLPNAMYGTLGEWCQQERPGGRNATAFEKENPNILMLNANGTGEFKNM